MIGGEFRAGVFVAALLLLAGCSGGSGGATPLPAETSATTAAVVTTSASPPPVAPVAEKTAKGAEEFVRYFWAVYDYSYSTGDTATLQAISGKTCAFCEGAAKEIAKAQSQGLHQDGGEINPVAIRAAPGVVKTSVVVISVLNQNSSRVVNADGSAVTTSEALTAAKADARLDWNSGSWIVGAVAIETSGR